MWRGTDSPELKKWWFSTPPCCQTEIGGRIVYIKGIPMTSLLVKYLGTGNYDFILGNIDSAISSSLWFHLKLLWQKNHNPQARVYLSSISILFAGVRYLHIEAFFIFAVHFHYWSIFTWVVFISKNIFLSLLVLPCGTNVYRWCWRWMTDTGGAYLIHTLKIWKFVWVKQYLACLTQYHSLEYHKNYLLFKDPNPTIPS